MKSPFIADQFKVYGATPIPIAYKSTYKALSDRAVDVLENPLVSISARKFYEVQTDLVMSDHAYVGTVFLFSKNFGLSSH